MTDRPYHATSPDPSTSAGNHPDRRKTMEGVNAEPTAGHPPLLRALTAAATDDPAAIRVGDRQISRAELFHAASALAAEIQGAPAVAVLAMPCLETVVAVVAGLLAGVPVVPLPADVGTVEREHILTDSKAALLLDPNGQVDSGDPPRIPVVPIRRAGGGTVGALPEPDPGAPALVLYTSGTTGAPKGVVISRRAIAACLDALAEAWAWTPEDLLVHGLPLYHVHGLVLGVLGPLRTGSRLAHTERPTPQRYAAAGGTLYFGVPTVWSRVTADPAATRALRGARLLVSGSAALPVPVFERLSQLAGQRPVERYGMTEALIVLSTRFDGERRPGRVGFPLAGVRTRLATEDGTAVPHDGESIGELEVQAPMLFDGYLNQPEATRRSYTPDGWFRTGDMATIDPDGWHRIVGRASVDLIKSGGFRIGAGEVENALLAHPAVAEAAVVGQPDADLGQRIVAYVVADGVTEGELIDFVARSLSVHKRPRQVRFVPALPRNTMGKVRKTDLIDGPVHG